MIHIVGAATYSPGSPKGILIQMNAAITGTITISDSNGTQAIITNAALGSLFKYWGFTGAVSVVTSATTDATISNIDHVA